MSDACSALFTDRQSCRRRSCSSRNFLCWEMSGSHIVKYPWSSSSVNEMSNYRYLVNHAKAYRKPCSGTDTRFRIFTAKSFSKTPCVRRSAYRPRCTTFSGLLGLWSLDVHLSSKLIPYSLCMSNYINNPNRTPYSSCNNMQKLVCNRCFVYMSLTMI